MPRKPTVRDLPDINEILPPFKGLKPDSSCKQALTDSLRACAKALQTDKARTFYSMREVAKHYKMPLRTTALVYEALEMEGLLRRIRGSQTMLVGKERFPMKPVNGVIGLPIWLNSMIVSPFDCALQVDLNENMRMKGFVADSIFYQTSEECEPDLALRLQRHNLDLLVWHTPHPLSMHILMSLRERGIRLVLLQSTESFLRIPARNFLFDWQPAYRKMVAKWCGEDIRRVMIPQPSHLHSRRALKRLVPLLEEAKLQVEIVPMNAESLKKSLGESTGSGDTPSTVLAFMDTQSADMLCNGHPSLLENIAVQTRLAFCRGAIRAPRLNTKRIAVDVVELDSSCVARAVVEDICNPRREEEGSAETFEAVYHPQIIMRSIIDGDEDALPL